jgi:UDP-GlcNAc:undecaprenyl-phosphate/decaprenyl-phosphate GlcNAc-1-phosphate transferase
MEPIAVNNLFIFITALVVSIGIVPVMIRLAPRLGMIDLPDPRKVHSIPIPRVGGIGIVVGALIPIILWLPIDAALASYLFGALVLLGFGVWDDSRELGHYVKFIGQFIAVIGVVYFGDVYVTHLPFLEPDTLSDSITKPFSVIAMIGMINAINHSDGLDGLAGGLSILSLCCIGYLAYLADGQIAVAIVCATLGGVFGFLRYNTHPAKVFMGDGGSQFLGFTLGFLAIVLTQQVNTALSPALPALFLGLPIIDILAVFAQRIYHKMNWFRATKNHIHHRLLELGFYHYEAVVIIYTIQTSLVLSALFLSYETDALVISLYLSVCVMVLVFIYLPLHKGVRIRQDRTGEIDAVARLPLHNYMLIKKGPLALVTIAIPLLFLFTSISSNVVARDFGIGASVLALILLVILVIKTGKDSIVLRAVVYVTAAFVIYLETKLAENSDSWITRLEMAYFIGIALATAFAVKLGNNREFRTNPMDYLVIFIVLSTGLLYRNMSLHDNLGFMVAKLVIIFYGCELIASRSGTRFNILNLVSLATLTILGARGLGFAS